MLIRRSRVMLSVVSLVSLVVPLAIATNGGVEVSAATLAQDDGDDDDQGDDGKPRPVPDVVLPPEGRWNVKLGDEPRTVGKLPVTIAPVDEDGFGRRLTVTSLGTEVADAIGLAGLGLFVEPTDKGGPLEVEFTVDYSGFAERFGGDYASRLIGGTVAGCVVGSSADDSLCDGAATDVGGVNDLEAQSVTFTVTAGDTTGGGPNAVQGFARLQDGGGNTASGLLAKYQGSTGNFTQTSLSPSAEWSQGGSSGGFSWSYGFGLPDVGVGGPTPGFALSLSSQSVDGMNSNTNSQAGQAGLGWSLSGQAFIERSYAPCTQVGGSAGDLCWNGQNASLVLNGVSSPLVPLDAGHNVWRLEHDNGWRVNRYTAGGTGEGSPTADNDGEWWEVVTQDGSIFRFGANGASKASSSATWAVPVIGAYTGDQCKTRSPNICYQGWRWNLDHVVDPVGVSMQYAYDTELNYYGARGRPNAAIQYVRGGLISEVRWGIPVGAASWDSATHRMTFQTEFRCNTLNSSCAAPTKKSSNEYPDVPVDLVCEPNKGCPRYTPSFFTAKRLVQVDSATRTSAGWRPVDRWVMSHGFPGGGGELVRLFLRTVQRVNPNNTSETLPAVRFESILPALANRHDFNLKKGVSDMRMFRVHQIRDELGGEIDVTYGQPDGCEGRPSSGWSTNTQNCYPQWWSPKGASPGFGVFNKYVVTQVVQGALGPNASLTDHGTGYIGVPVTTRYTYHGGGGWRHAEQRGVSNSNQSWSQWRGYAHVVTETGLGADRGVSDVRYFRGLNGGRSSGGGTASVSVQSQFGPTSKAPVVVADEDWFQGRVLESRLSHANGREISASISIPEVIKSAVGVDSGDHLPNVGYQGDLVSHMVVTPQVWSRTAKGTNPFAHYTRVDTTYDPTYMLPTSVHQWGDTLIGGNNNDRCTTTNYATNTGLTVDRPASIRLRERDCAGDVAAKTDYVYDSTGRITTETVWNGQYGSLVSRVGYGSDPFRRPVSVTDPNGNTTQVGYSANAGVLSTVTVTNPLGHASTMMRDVRGSVVSSVDPNGHVSSGVFDGFGRLTSFRSPTERTGPETVRYTYELVTNNSPGGYKHGLNQVTSSTLVGGSDRVDTVAYIDGLGRTLESQAPSPAGGRIVSATVHNDRGLAARSIDSFHASGGIGDSPLSLAGISTQQHETRTAFDAAGRSVKTDELVDGSAVNTVMSVYDALTTTVTPSLSASTITTIDGYGRTVSTFDGAGLYESSYDVRDLPVSSGPSNAQIQFEYDDAGRLRRTIDPNGGRRTTGRDSNGNINRISDSEENFTIIFYDALNRPWLRRASPNGVPTSTGAQWRYDGLGLGLLEWVDSYQPDGTYRMSHTGYDERNRSLGVTYRLPDWTTYTESVTSFNAVDQPLGMNLDGFGSMPAEPIGFGYDHLGNPTTMTADGANIVAGTTYDNLGRVSTRRLGADEVTRSYQYSPRRLLESLTATVGGVTVQDDRYVYNAEANITAIDHVVSGHRECFELDTQARLTRGYTVNSGAGCGGGANVNVAPAGAGYDQRWLLSPYGDIGRRTDITAADSETIDYVYGPGPNQIGQYGTTGLEYNGFGARVGTTFEPPAVGVFEAVENTRLLDTREGAGVRVAANDSVLIDASGVIPDGATSVMINVIAAEAENQLETSLSVWPAAGRRNSNAVVYNVRFPAISQLTIVAVDHGRFRVGANKNATHVIVDLVGVFIDVDIATNQAGVTAGRVLPVVPYRAYDSRDATNPLVADEHRLVSVADPSLPADATAVIATLTATNITEHGFFTALATADDDGTKPSTSSLNVSPGSDRANQIAVVVPLDENRQFSIYSLAGGDIIVDITAYVTGDNSPAGVDGLYTALRTPKQIRLN